jgi:DNA-binding transcriptional ArsR family regulator
MCKTDADHGGFKYTKNMPDTLERLRSKLFRRNDEKPMGAITERDIALLRNIGHHRLITSDDLALLDGGSQQNLLRALRVLFDLGLVERPEAQKARWIGSNTAQNDLRPLETGCPILARKHGNGSTESDHSARNRRAGCPWCRPVVSPASVASQRSILKRNSPSPVLIGKVGPRPRRW